MFPDENSEFACLILSQVPRGYAAAFPTKYVFDEDEYGRIAKLAKLQLEDAEEDLEEAKAAEKSGSGSAKNGSKAEQDKE